MHVDVKKSGLLRDGGAGGCPRQRPVPPDPHRPRVGFSSVHAAIDDHTHLAYAEIHPDEKAHHGHAALGGHPLISRVNNPAGHGS
ncbi:hypothetical protein ACQPZA_04050 [Pseudonocardia xinjiangensis]|uniref:hypothetical protein n=1 Tax=Pseudonocardia xinjiangensis TaxID=75289 RepID=UPI003D928C5F